MANIDDYLRIILNGVYGRDVRKAIHDGIRKCYDDNSASPEQVEAIVTQWLEDHPESTTTIEDGAITEAKLSDELKTKTIKKYVTPEMYGAKGDGVTDDTQALQACVTAGNVLHLNGTYKISAGIELHSNLHIYGFGKGRIVKNENTQTDFSALYYYDTDTVITNVLIDGLEIVGLKHWTGVTVTGDLNDFGIRIKNSERVKIINCNVLDCGACAIALAGIDCKISGNTIKYTGTFISDLPNYNFGINYSGETYVISDNTISGVIQGIISGLVNKNVRIINNDISTNGQHGLYMEGAENVIVSGNTIHDCSVCGVKFQKDRVTTVFENITISDNIIDNCGAQGVLVVTLNGTENGYIHDVIISNNNIKNCSRCINITWVNRCIINGNILTNGQEYGIYGNVCDDLTCSSNRLYMYGVNSIYVQNGSGYTSNKNIKISDNYIFLSGTKSGSPACINVSTGSNMMIVNNLCIADTESEYISDYDGIKLTYTGEITYNRYLIGNVVHGFRWDFRLLSNTNVTFANNYYDRANGIPT